MNQADFDRIHTQIQRAIYDNELAKASTLLLKLIDLQSKSIKELKDSLKDN